MSNLFLFIDSGDGSQPTLVYCFHNWFPFDQLSFLSEHPAFFFLHDFPLLDKDRSIRSIIRNNGGGLNREILL